MKEQKLISMVDFVDYVSENTTATENEHLEYKILNKIMNYSIFLKQTLTLGIFVPCDLEGNVLEEPKFELYPSSSKEDIDVHIQYQQAKERVLFEGFRIVKKSPHYDWHITNESGSVFIYLKGLEEMTVQSLVKRNPTLTPTACKQIGWE